MNASLLHIYPYRLMAALGVALLTLVVSLATRNVAIVDSVWSLIVDFTSCCPFRPELVSDLLITHRPFYRR